MRDQYLLRRAQTELQLSQALNSGRISFEQYLTAVSTLAPVMDLPHQQVHFQPPTHVPNTALLWDPRPIAVVILV